MRFFSDLSINSRQKLWHRFEDSHFGTQTSPDTAHLETNHASTNHAKLLGNSTDVQGTVIGQNLLLVKGQTWQLACRRACCDHDMFAHNVSLGCAANLDRPTTIDLTREGAFAMEKSDLVLFEQVQNTIVVLFHNAIFAADHFVELE